MYLYKKVLVVDNLNSRNDITNMLSDLDYIIIFIDNYFDALEAISNEKPSLIISNVQLGNQSGFEFLRDIKEKYHDILIPPFIFMSEDVSLIDIRRAIKFGAVDLIPLPVQKEELIETLESNLNNFNFIKDAVVKQERNWLSEELHDNIQQIILASLMHLRFLETEAYKLDDLSREAFFMTLSFLEKAIEETRNLSHQMHEVVNSSNFLEKINSIIGLLEKNKILIDVTIPYKFNFYCSNEDLFHLIRSFQELVNNIIKHSKASKVVLSISSSKNSLDILLNDNGVGFSIDEYSNFGLTVVKRRLNKINAEFSIDSEIGKGVTAHINLTSKVKV